MFTMNPVHTARHVVRVATRGRLRATVLTTAVAASLLAVQSTALGCVTPLQVRNLTLAEDALATPASAGTTRVSGIGVFNTECQAPVGSPPADLGDYPPIDLTGSLNGCWYTYVSASQFNPSGTYLEQGTEIFVGCLNGLACGTFQTLYTFTGKYTDPTFAQEIHGRCEHRIVDGTGDFAGATGVILFKDDVVNLKFDYRGNISLSK
jgi:hypothetical protein